MRQLVNLALKVHSNEPSAVEATASTIESLKPGTHIVARDRTGTPIITDGEIFAYSSDPRYVVWAAMHQGYVEAAGEIAPREVG